MVALEALALAATASTVSPSKLPSTSRSITAVQIASSRDRPRRPDASHRWDPTARAIDCLLTYVYETVQYTLRRPARQPGQCLSAHSRPGAEILRVSRRFEPRRPPWSGTYAGCTSDPTRRGTLDSPDGNRSRSRRPERH